MTEQEYHQFYHDCQAAIDFLIKIKGGVAVAALHHPILGDIDLVWGNSGDKRSKGYGLAKIVEHHPEVLEGMQEIFNRMTLVKYRGVKGFDILDGKRHYAATIRINYNNTNRKWLMTMFKKVKAPKK